MKSADVMLIFKNRGYKRKNPFCRTLEKDEQIKETKESVKHGTRVLSTDNLHHTMKNNSTFVANPILVDERCKKVAKRSKTLSIKEDGVDNTIDDNDFDEIDGERSEDGDENVDIVSQENKEGGNIATDLYQNERLQNMKSDHILSQIPPTERKKWPQKECVCCRKYGVRRDTRYICSLCNAALCKEPCFSEYHCSKHS